MQNLPKGWEFLANEGGPLMLDAALGLLGTIETPGVKSSPTIMAWVDEVGKDVAYFTADSIPWCGLFMAVVAKRGKKTPPKASLRALSWATFGNYSPTPGLGDVLVFVRDGGGHVGLYVGHSATHYYVLGGNQNDAVNISAIPKGMLYTCRRPAYKVKPKNVRPIPVKATAAGVVKMA